MGKRVGEWTFQKKTPSLIRQCNILMLPYVLQAAEILPNNLSSVVTLLLKMMFRDSTVDATRKSSIGQEKVGRNKLVSGIGNIMVEIKRLPLSPSLDQRTQKAALDGLQYIDTML